MKTPLVECYALHTKFLTGSQYLSGLDDVAESSKCNLHPKIAYMRIGSATNSRTAISSFLDVYPAGDSVFFFRPLVRSYLTSLLVSANLNSLAYDYHLRNRVGGLNLSEFIMVETAVIPRELLRCDALMLAIVKLALCSESHAVAWESVLTEEPSFAVLARKKSWRACWAVSVHERVRLRAIVDACFAHFYGLSEAEFAYLLSDCDQSNVGLNAAYANGHLNPKGLWRVGKDLAPELRHTVLSLVAFKELQAVGVESFLAMNDSDGWHIPETLCLADYGLGHDERAKVPQPVASRLGPRFLDWQLNEDVERSWEECAAHAALIRRIVPLSDSTLVDVDGGGPAPTSQEKTVTYKQEGLF